jgi:phenylalanyl-tRNA synthetase alpha chain
MISEKEAEALERIGDEWNNAKELGNLEGLIPWLENRGLIDVREEHSVIYELTEEGKRYVKEGLPEKKALLLARDGRIKISELEGESGRIAVIWLRRFGAKIEGGEILLDDAETVRERIEEFESALINPSGASEETIRALISRKLIVEKVKAERFVKIREDGKKTLEGFRKSGKKILTRLDRDSIKNFELYEFKEYDVSMPVRPAISGKKHPLKRIIDEIRDIFVSMGFEEITGNFVESSFWDMDALFVPQQHPARDLQDTFYLKNPATIDIKEREYAEIVKNVHETGGSTGSKGWGYKWSYEEAERALLRTHTTVCSVKYMRDNSSRENFKAFTVGRIFRRENPDPTHLPEFTQIDGIMSEKNASLSMLIGVLKNFYSKMGFDNIRVKPSYFPYTEPSLEVEVLYNGRYLELGGAGVFRAEVTEPLGVKNPVLAWGLGVERLAMLRYNLKSIKEIYMSDVEWIQACSYV